MKIVLEKVTGVGDGPGALPIKAEYAWTYTSASRETARQRAWRALKRDFPNENPMNWQEKKPAAAAA